MSFIRRFLFLNEYFVANRKTFLEIVQIKDFTDEIKTGTFYAVIFSLKNRVFSYLKTHRNASMSSKMHFIDFRRFINRYFFIHYLT